MDGVTVGHPCCAVHECKTLLFSKRDHFCAKHTTKSLQCCIIDPPCLAAAEEGFRSCQDPVHRALDLASNERGKSFFQLSQCLEHAKISHPTNSLANMVPQEDSMESDHDDATVNHYVTQYSSDKPAINIWKVCVRWARRQTHNEQLIVRPCGVIVARQTMFGAEGITAVKVSKFS